MLTAKSILSAGALLSLLALAACSGANASDVSGGAAPSGPTTNDPNNATPPSASTSTPGSSSSSSSSSSSGAPVTPGSDAGADANNNPIVPKPSSIAKHCTGPLAAPDVCVENVEGRAGDVVEVEVHLLGSASCSEAQEASVRIIADPALFELMNESDVQNCRTRRFDPTNVDELMWHAFGANTATGCVDYLQLGHRDTIKLKIRPGTPAGDYALTLKDAGFVGDTGTCQTFGGGLGGTLRVLP